MRIRWILIVSSIAMSLSCAHAPPRGTVTWSQILGLPLPPTELRIAYGEDSLAFGELRLPEGTGPHPVAVIIHGGCWRSEYDLKHITHVSAALTSKGIATWTLEYRRIGDAGGGWPGTFEDVARGTDFLRELARRHPLDLDRVVLVGHSAGGHLALWLAARPRLPRASVFASPDPLPVRGVVGLAAIGDLRAYAAGTAWCNASVPLLLGGTPAEVPERYAEASPIELLPLGVPVRLIQGTADTIVPIEQGSDFATRAKAAGDDARYVPIEGAGHFDLIAPTAAAWEQVEAAVVELLGRR